jgi:CDP-paratose 2-epimerase
VLVSGSIDWREGIEVRMAIAIITGSGGLIGSEAARMFAENGLDVVGIDNDTRRVLFGAEASTEASIGRLVKGLPRYQHCGLDIRDAIGVDRLFALHNREIVTIIHTAAQPSHDWAARDPLADFSINAVGTLNLLEAYRKHCPKASFLFTSTNKVYGDRPNALPMVELATRWEIEPSHEYAEFGIDENMSIDQCKHSLFGVSKSSADLMVQEYGRYFGLNTTVFRGGCLTGPAHAATELHGFLAYVAKCVCLGRPYTIFGYKGKQVRDNIHSVDLIRMFWEVFKNPRQGEVYNVGGGRRSNCSVLEAISLCERISGRTTKITVSEDERSGDHIWYISDIRKFQRDYPEWTPTISLETTVEQIVDSILNSGA